jgi:hypothetical protein
MEMAPPAPGMHAADGKMENAPVKVGVARRG